MSPDLLGTSTTLHLISYVPTDRRRGWKYDRRVHGRRLPDVEDSGTPAGSVDIPPVVGTGRVSPSFPRPSVSRGAVPL